MVVNYICIAPIIHEMQLRVLHTKRQTVEKNKIIENVNLKKNKEEK